MGHLSRQLTLALSGAGDYRTVLFSLSKALPRIMAAESSGDLPEAQGLGIRYEYCPAWNVGWFPTRGWQAAVRRRYRSYRWHPYLRDRIISLVAETGAQAVIFDGVVPYDGLLQARAALPGVRFGWVRRGMWRPGAPEHRLDASQHFDLTIEPQDLGESADRGPTRHRTDTLRLPPVSLTDVLEPTTRDQARRALGLPSDRPVLLLAPGSGFLGSVDRVAEAVLRSVRAHGGDWAVAVTRQSIASHGIGAAGEDVILLDDVYPLARHLAAFDAAVGAAGYNAVHELLGAGVPTLFVPSTKHETDDQEARAAGVAARGAALTTVDGIADAVRELLDATRRDELAQACRSLERPDGGRAAATAVGELAAAGVPVVDPPIATPSRPWPDLRLRAKPGSEASISFTEAVDGDQVRGTHPIEHMIAGSSQEYRRARARAASWIYRAD